MLPAGSQKGNLTGIGQAWKHVLDELGGEGAVENHEKWLAPAGGFFAQQLKMTWLNLLRARQHR
jgi:hypothetical protein